MHSLSLSAYSQSWKLTLDDELLLKAAVLKDARGSAAWDVWKSRAEWNNLNWGSQQILPLVYQNLSSWVQDPLMHKIKGIYRWAWYRNHMLFRALEDVTRLFEAAGIKTVLLKGTALVLCYYHDYGLRLMSDMDLLVSKSDFLPALDLLAEQGWEDAPGEMGMIDRVNVFEKTVKKGGSALDLHWRIFHTSRKAFENDFWENLRTVKLNSREVFVLSPAHQLLHVLVHGARWRDIPMLQWVPDSLQILSSSDVIDWDRFLYQVKVRSVRLQVRDALGYLKDIFDAPVPTSALRKVRRPFATIREYVHYIDIRGHQFHTSKTVKKPVWIWKSYLASLWVQNQQKIYEFSNLQILAGFFKYLQNYFGVRSLWQIPFYAIYKMMQKSWKLLKTLVNTA